VVWEGPGQAWPLPDSVGGPGKRTGRKAGTAPLGRPNSQIQALDRSAPILPMLPGTPQRATHDYKRSGTSSLYAALDITTGKVIGALHSRHRAIEFKRFLATLDQAVPRNLDVHLILDNASTHKTPAIQKWLAAHPRFVLHFTPTSSSWLNLVERWFAELTNKKLKRGAHRSVRALNQDIRDWIETWNENPRPFVWTKTADQILTKANPRKKTSDTRHRRGTGRGKSQAGRPRRGRCPGRRLRRGLGGTRVAEFVGAALGRAGRERAQQRARVDFPHLLLSTLK
jgi:transposase